MNEKPDKNPWLAASLVGAIGVDLAVFMAAGFFGGRTIAAWTSHQYWIVIGIMAGLLAGIASVVMIMRRFMGDRHG
ncbi:MAG TPA: hypothetical protein VF260_13280 [Bacilli bacterium]